MAKTERKSRMKALFSPAQADEVQTVELPQSSPALQNAGNTELQNASRVKKTLRISREANKILKRLAEARAEALGKNFVSEESIVEEAIILLGEKYR